MQEAPKGHAPARWCRRRVWKIGLPRAATRHLPLRHAGGARDTRRL